MDLFHNRPFALASFSAVVLTLAVTALEISHRWIFSLVLLFGAILLLGIALVRRKCGKGQSTAILFCLLAAVLLFGSWSFFNRKVDFLKAQSGKTVTAEGVVLERIGTSASQSTFAFSLEELDGDRIDQEVLLKCGYLSALRAGERVRVTGTVEGFASLKEDPDVSFSVSEGLSGILNCAEAKDCSVVASGERLLRVKLSEWNAALSEKLVERLGKREGGLAAALVLGNRSFLSAVDTVAFRRVGISHFLALSGLHVGILIAAVECLLRLFRVPRAFRIWAIIPLSVFYLAVTGASPSTVRAVCMAAMLSVAFLLRRNYDSPTAIFTVLFIILAVQPCSIVDNGLWLSFLAAGGIVIFVPAVRKALADQKPKKAIHPVKRVGKALLLSLSVGAFAFAATLPISAFLFGEASILSVPATLVLSPLLSVALVFSALSLLIPVQPIYWITEKLLLLLRWAAFALSEWRGITVRLQDRITLILIVVLAISLFLCAVLKFRKKLFAVTPLVFVVLAFLSAYSVHWFGQKAVQTAYFSQKSNEYLLFSVRGKATLVDLSGGNRNDSYQIVGELHSMGCTELEELALTHYHAPATYLLNCLAEKVKIRTLLLPTPANGEETAVSERLAEEAELLGIRCEIADRSSALPDLTIQWMHDAGIKEPAVTVVAQTDQASMVWCNSQFSSAAQTKFFRQYAAGANVFLFGQHGSTSGERRELPAIGAAKIFVGEWKGNSTPFLPPENRYYQTVSGVVRFSLS